MRRKDDIVAKLLSDFPGGPDVQIAKIKPSDLETWIAGYAPTTAAQRALNTPRTTSTWSACRPFFALP